MPELLAPKIEIKTKLQSGYSLNSIVNAPRTASPLDLKAACDNIQIGSSSEEVPGDVLALVTYLLTDFFKLSHRTGLYNRQRILWESLSRIVEADVIRLNKGLFSKVELPLIDVIFKDVQGNAIVFAHLVEPYEQPGRGEVTQAAANKVAKETLNSFIYRAHKLQNRSNSLAGLFLCCPKDFPEIVLTIIAEQTASTDPVARYESVLPSLKIPINLLEMSWRNGPEMSGAYISRVNSHSIKLIHPNLGAKAKPLN